MTICPQATPADRHQTSQTSSEPVLLRDVLTRLLLNIDAAEAAPARTGPPAGHQGCPRRNLGPPRTNVRGLFLDPRMRRGCPGLFGPMLGCFGGSLMNDDLGIGAFINNGKVAEPNPLLVGLRTGSWLEEQTLAPLQWESRRCSLRGSVC